MHTAPLRRGGGGGGRGGGGGALSFIVEVGGGRASFRGFFRFSLYFRLFFSPFFSLPWTAGLRLFSAVGFGRARLTARHV